MPYASLSELPDYVKKRSATKQRQWRAVFNEVYGRTGSEEKAFKAANAALSQEVDMDKLKEIAQMRLDSLRQALEQAGKRLSKVTLEKMKTIMKSMQDLMDGAEIDDMMMESVWSPVGAILLQGIVSGESIDDSYERIQASVSNALRNNKPVDSEWVYNIYTWPDRVVFRAEGRTPSGDYEYRTYRAGWSGSGTNITFSDVQEVTVQEVVTALQEALAQADKVLIQAAQPFPTIPTPQGFVIQQGEGKPAFLLQQTSAKPDLVQEVPGGKGTVRFGGVATVADLVNTYGQVYKSALWQKQVDLAQEQIMGGRLVGATWHPRDAGGQPRSPYVHEISHKFTSLYMQDSQVRYEAETLLTDAGKNLAAVLTGGVGIDTSTRATGTTTKGEWQGQSVHFVNEDDFTLYGIDVVLNGASPGSAVEYARLQSLDAEPDKEKTMVTEAITKLIEDAIAAGNSTVADKLQALEQAITKVESGVSQAALGEADKALLEQAKALIQKDAEHERRDARDKKVGEIADSLVQKKELPMQFRGTFAGFLTDLCRTADEVDGKVATVKERLQPFLVQHTEYASRGYYAPEYNDDATKVEAPQTRQGAIDELVQSATERGLLHAGTGVKIPGYKGVDFSDTRWVMTRMLQTLAQEKPWIADAYLMKRNGLLEDIGDAQELLNRNVIGPLVQNKQCGYGPLSQAPGNLQTLHQAGEMKTTDIAAAVPFVFPMVAEVWPQLLAWQLGTVQPLARSSGRIYYWKLYQDDGSTLLSAGANFTGSYANDPGEKVQVKYIKGKISSADVTTEIKKLGYDLSVEVIRHLRSDFGMDASPTMLQAVAEEIAREWNYQILADLIDGAGAGNVNYGTTIPAGGAYDGTQWQEQFPRFINRARDLIYENVYADTVWVIGEPRAISRITDLSKEVGEYIGAGKGRIAQGVDIVGSTKTGEKLVKVGWWDTLRPDKLLVAGVGDMWPKTGYVIAPYLGLYVTPVWVDPQTQDVIQSTQSELARKMVESKYFATVTIQEGTAGTAL